MIEKYSFGIIVIDGKSYNADIKIIDDRVIPDWWRNEGHSICKEDIEDIIALKPDVFILGTGSYGVLRVSEKFRELMKSLNIKLIFDTTDKACALYNKLSKEKKCCFGAHLTC